MSLLEKYKEYVRNCSSDILRDISKDTDLEEQEILEMYQNHALAIFKLNQISTIQEFLNSALNEEFLTVGFSSDDCGEIR